MTLEDIENYLKNIQDRDNSNERHEEMAEVLRELKVQALRNDDQEMATKIWCYEQILYIQKRYLGAFELMKDEEYYPAWNSLDDCETALRAVKRHFPVYDTDEFFIGFIHTHVKQYQSLYPYKLFISPELLIKEQECSICGAIINIRKSCGHQAGEIYNGEICTRVVKDFELLATAFVSSPVQRYSVPFLKDPKTDKTVDHYNYQLVEYLIKRLQSPFDEWQAKWSKKRHPHSFFPHIRRSAKCPCESGLKYKNCCLKNEEGVLRPHCTFVFSNPPSKNLMKIQYCY